MSRADIQTGPPPETSERTELATREESAHRPPVLSTSTEFSVQSMQQLLHFAIERETPVEALEKLVDLAERMQATEARRAFHEAMAHFQAECEPVFRAKKVDYTTKSGGSVKFDYASLDDIVKMINPILAKYGLSYTWNTRVDKNMLSVDTVVRHMAGHSETTTFTLPIDSNASMGEQQKYGAALTFGQRRGLSSALGLVTTAEDPDTPKLDPSPISEDQAIVINDLLEETRMPLSRFLKYFEASSVATIRAVDYQAAIGVLEDRKKKAVR